VAVLVAALILVSVAGSVILKVILKPPVKVGKKDVAPREVGPDLLAVVTPRPVVLLVLALLLLLVLLLLRLVLVMNRVVSFLLVA
jgi:hypothetical protein